MIDDETYANYGVGEKREQIEDGEAVWNAWLS